MQQGESMISYAMGECEEQSDQLEGQCAACKALCCDAQRCCVTLRHQDKSQQGLIALAAVRQLQISDHHVWGAWHNRTWLSLLLAGRGAEEAALGASLANQDEVG